MSFLNYFSKDVGVDLGTANSLIYLNGRGIVVNQPSIAAINAKTSVVLAVGDEAKKMLSRTPPHINVVRPLVNGVISDFEVTQEILKHFLKMADSSSFGRYRMAVLGVPSNLTEVERKSVEDAALGAGVGRAYVIEEAVAATLGAGLPIDEPTSNMVVDIGGGTTDIAIISLGGSVVAKSLKIAGDHFNQDIINFVRDEFKLLIGEPTAEEVKIAVGSAIPLDEKLEIAIRGRDLASGLPREIIIKNTHARVALARSLKYIVDAIKEVIEIAPPELVGDIYRNGVHLCGGGSLLRGIDTLIAKELSVKCFIIDEPLTCVARGIGRVIENFDNYKRFLDNPIRPREINL
ncbi:MAG: rod shape-determining protein [Candidatus Liptonbacteria bacterium]|nr:rod shape-determining protein [Candidatus Liptonbacteria bacterium]